MEGLTQEQLDFLRKYDVPLEKVFDAKGYSKGYYHDVMKRQGKIVAFNVTPCKRAGHTLRERNGHCIQCETRHLAFQMRNDYSGIIYIAGSKREKVLKIGYSKAIEIRNESLNRTKYAAVDDWEIIFGIFSPTAGQIESQIKSQLSKYSRTFNYEHDKKIRTTDEVYSCSFNKIKATFIQVCEEYYHYYEIKKDYDGNDYNFRNLSKL